MKTVAIIEARMKSTRLPGKVLKQIGGKNSIEHIVERLKKVTAISDICIATTNHESDDVIEELANSRNYRVYRGSEEDVLSRVLSAAEALSAEIIVEITGDCPFVDPILVDQYLEILVSNELDYVSNNISPTYPDGFDVQVFLTEALKKSSKASITQAEREHVTMHIRQNPQIFRTLNIIAPKPFRHPSLSVTLDTNEDLEVLRLILENFRDEGIPDHMEITKFLLANPEIASLNSSIQRKGFGI